MPLLVLINNGLTHIEMHTHILMTFHGMSALHRGKKTPFVQRFQQQRVQAGVLRRLRKFHFDCSVCVDIETRDGDCLIGVFAKIVGERRHWLTNNVCGGTR